MQNLFSMETPFARFMNVLANLLWVGLLWLVCSLPVVTCLAASMAAYHTMSRVVRRSRGYIAATFFTQFGHYLKRWLGLILLDLLVLAWLVFDIVYLYGYGTEFSQTLSYITYGILVLYLGVNAILMPCGSRFGGSRFEVFKISFYITFRHMLTTLGMLGLFVISAYLMYLMPWSVLVVPGVAWYAATYLMEPVLRRYTDGDEEDEEDDVEEDEEDDDDEDDDADGEIGRRPSRVKEDEDEIDDALGRDSRKRRKRKKRDRDHDGNWECWEDEDDDDDLYDEDDLDEEEEEDEAAVDKQGEVLSDDGEIEVIRIGKLVIRKRKREKRGATSELQPAGGYDEDGDEDEDLGSSVGLRDRVVPKSEARRPGRKR